ncbi:MAG: hypothetical protein IKI21_06275 [Oscillospiraceae bacterium]|nr:hypothetical protein [Oscillospiraceae bacterium]
MRRMIAAVLAAAALMGCLTACGSQTEAGTDVTETTAAETTAEAATETTAAETTAAETTAETEATTEAEADKSADSTAAHTGNWFERGVYAVLDGETVVDYYVFYDEKSGRTCDPEEGIGVGFDCEQEDDQVIFHMGSADDNTIMSMEINEYGYTMGTIGGFTYHYMPMSSEDPDTFDPTADPEAASQYDGTYSEEHAGRGVITVSNYGGNMCSVDIRWPGSATEVQEWSFTGSFDSEGALHYTDCTATLTTFTSEEESTTKTLYTNGTGTLQYVADGDRVGMTWKDDMEDVASDSFFVKD